MPRLLILLTGTAVGLVLTTTMLLCATPGRQNSEKKLPNAPAVRRRMNKQEGTQPEFGGTYDRLRSEQRKLVDDWFARYKALT